MVPVCAHCPNPAVATVRGGGPGPVLTIRTDRLADPATAAAWAKDLCRWGHVQAAADAHLTRVTRQEAGR